MGPPSHHLRQLFAHQRFRQLLATRLASQVTDGIFQVGLASFVFFSPERQTTAGKVASTFALLVLPYSLVGPFAGVLLDRWKRQRVLVIANLVRSLLVLVTATLVAADVTGPAFYVSALSVLSVNRFFLSALSASLPHVVPEDEIVLANALSTTSGTVTAIVGGGIGYLVRAIAGRDDAGVATILIVASVVYILSALLALRIPRDLLGPDPDDERPETAEALRRVARGIADGGRHLWSHRRAGHAMAAIASHRFFYGLSTISGVLLYRNYFNDPADTDAGLRGLATVFAAGGIGVVVGAAITPRAARRYSEERWVFALYIAAFVIEIGFGLSFNSYAFVIAAFFLGIVAQGSKICVDSLVQLSVDDAFRGRVFSFYDIVFNVAFVAAAALAAATLPPNGKSYVVIVTIALGYLVTGVLYRRQTRRWSAAQSASAH